MSRRSGATTGFYMSRRRKRAADPVPPPGRPLPSAPGLARMDASTAVGLCPFCLDPLAPSRGKPRKHCGDEACERAYHRTYQRDRRRGLLVSHQR